MNKELDILLKEVIKEYEDFMALAYQYSVLQNITKIYVGKDIFNEVLKDKAFPPVVKIDTIFHEGVHICLSDSLRDNEIQTYKSYYFNQGNNSATHHYCGNHRKNYIGFTEVYDYCTVCGKKLSS